MFYNFDVLYIDTAVYMYLKHINIIVMQYLGLTGKAVIVYRKNYFVLICLHVKWLAIKPVCSCPDGHISSFLAHHL